MSVTVYDAPDSWYGDPFGAVPGLIVAGSFKLRSISQFAPGMLTGVVRVTGPTAQVWMADVTFAPTFDPVSQDIEALIARLRGRSGVLRLANAKRLAPWYDRNLTPTVTGFSDGTEFTDGTGFADGYLPPNVYAATAAARGARYIVLGGFPASTANVLRRGDMIQVKPNGVPGNVPHLYQAMYGGSSDSSGNVGFAIEPGLRIGVTVGDQVGLRYASSVFRMLDDTQGEMQNTDSGTGNVGFSVVEALDLVP